MTGWTQRLMQKARAAPVVVRERMEPGLYDLSVRLRFWVSLRQVQQWADTTKLFFVLGMGRSGTALLARLLNQDPHAYVCHEPVRRDFRAGAEAQRNGQRAEHYVSSFRGKEIFLRASEHGSPIYGEVNSALRHHVYALMTLFPDATYLHLVRDGRALRTEVRTGEEQGGRVTIEAGLSEGDRVVLAPAGLADGDAVQEKR